MISLEKGQRPPYVPRVGDLVTDTRLGREGRAMGNEGPYWQLRPLTGGREWEADPKHLRPLLGKQRKPLPPPDVPPCPAAMDPAGAGTTTSSSRSEGDAVHTDVDPADPPKLRRECLVLIRDGHGAVLMVKPKHTGGWHLPGGHAHEGEPSTAAAVRELKEQTGITRQLSDVLLVDDVPAADEPRSAAGISLVFDGGTLTGNTAVQLPARARDALRGVRWVMAHEVERYTFPPLSRRILTALSCADHGMHVPAYAQGRPAPA